MDATAPPLVGREPEVAALERALATVAGGRPWVVGITGEPGIGKSRLLGELARRAADRGHLVVAGRAAELERDVPFALWAEALEPRLDAAALEALTVDELADLAVALPAAGVAPAATGERHRVARAVRRLLERLAAERPVTVLLDDVHWADPASADVIALLLHRPPPRPVLLALAARSGRAPALEAALQSAVRHDGAEALAIGALSRAAADALLPATLGPATREHLFRESGGNPFYLEALGAASGIHGAPAAGGVHATGVGVAGVPRAVTAALAAEVAALGDAARALAQGAAVAGDPFDPAIAAAAAGVREDAALAALDEVLAADLVRPGDQPRRFGFRHPLVRRAVYESVPGGWRLAAHARAAQALAGRGATAAERAHHVERAAHHGDVEAAGLLAEAAAQTLPTAPATAAGWYAAALRLLPDAAEHAPRRLALLEAHATALSSAGRVVEARDVLRRLHDLLPPAAVAERVRVTVALAELETVWTQQPDVARARLEAERAAVGELSPGLAAALTLALAAERAEYGDHPVSERLANEARAGARAAGDRVLEAAAAATAADAANCRLRGEDPAALDAIDDTIAEAVAVVAALTDAEVAERLYMLLSLTIARFFAGDLRGAREAVERGLRVARATAQGHLAPAFVSVRGFVEHERGNLDAAERDEEEALESALISGNVQVEYWASIQFCWLALARGRVDAALEHGRRAWELLGTRPYSQAGFSVADARLAAGDPQGALAALETFGWVRPELWTLDRTKAGEIAVRVLLALGRVEDAAAWARRLPAEGGGRRDGVFGAILARAQAAVLLAQGAAAEAAAVALAGAAAGDRGGAPLWAGRCRTLGGEALAAAGRRREARDELRRAAADLGALGAWGHRDAAVRALRRLGERPRPPAPPPPEGDRRLAVLSPRQREVAALLGEGQTNAQIAARLHLSESTVEKHVTSVLGRLGLSSRAGVPALLARERERAP